MKTLLTLCLAASCGASLLHAERPLAYPKGKPALSFEVPDDWKPQYKNGSLFVLPPDGDNTIIEVATLEAGLDDLPGAVKEAKATVSDFKKLSFKKGTGTEGDDLKDGLKFTVFNGKGEDKVGPAIINLIVLGNPATGKNYLLSAISSQDSFDKHGAAISNILGSMAAAGAPKPGPVTSQTFNYPDKANMEFSVNFPADWNVKITDEGCYGESPDKLIPCTVLFIDAADVGVARESMKKKVGATYTSIKWNQGGEPNVTDLTDETGYKVTFDNGDAVDGADKYSVNFVEYVRPHGSKFMLMLFQMPNAAIDKHAEEIQMIVKSVQARK